MFWSFEGNDAQNLSRKRNIRNTNKEDYNCGGYAFGTFNWLVPCEDEAEYYRFDGLLHKGRYDDALLLGAARLREIFPDYKIVGADFIHVGLSKKYNVVAFRVSKDDFHFWKLTKGGTWVEKRGAYPEIYRHKFDEVFELWERSDGGYAYDSKIIFFVKKREEEQ